MNDFTTIIDFNKLSPAEFEELCFELILKLGFFKVSWNRGGADSGRDIEAYSQISNNLLGSYSDRFFIECKHHEKGVPPEKLHSKVAWADAEKPDHLVFLISSHLTDGSRIWLDKIRPDKPYKIHVIDGIHLKKYVAQHDDLLKKFFFKNDATTLLTETKKNWLIHGIIPSFTTLTFLFENLDLDNLPSGDLVFLYILYYSNYSKMEQLENRVYHGIDIDKYIEFMEQNLTVKATYKESLISKYDGIETLSSEGCLVGNDDEEQVQYTFMATDMLINDPKHSTSIRLGVKVIVHDRLAVYLFKRISDRSALEILLFRNSDFENQIRIIEGYTFDHFKEAVGLLGLKPAFRDEILISSFRMKTE